MINPQLEDGYTKIADEILENMARVKLSPTQYRIIFVVWRYTYGFNRKCHYLSLSFLEKATGCDRRSLQREVKKMIDQRILVEQTTEKQTRSLGFNKRFSEWGVGETTNGNSANGNSATGGETTTSSVGETTISRGGETTTQDKQYTNIYTDHDHNAESESENTVDTPKIVNLFTSTFGYLPNQIQLEMLLSFLNDGLTEWHLQEALKRTAEVGANSPNYTKAILNGWLNKGVKTKEDVERLDQMREGRSTDGQVPQNDRSRVQGISLSMSTDRGSSKWDHLYEDYEAE